MFKYFVIKFLWFFGIMTFVFQLVFAQRWAVNDTIYLHSNAVAHLDVLSNDTGFGLTILDVLVTEGPSRGYVERDFTCNCLAYTPGNDFGISIFEDTFYYTLSMPPNPETGSPALINLAQVVIFFMADECDDCVWPGDTNADGICNAWDLLPLGMAYGTYGMPRASISSDWGAHESTDWTESFGDVLNYKHADCNGDGVINNSDINALSQNYSMTHEVSTIPDMPYSGGDITISLEILNESVEIGDTVVANVLISGSTGDVDVYGLAFSINYNVVPDSSTVDVNFPVSFLNDGYNTISIQRQVGNNIEAAITRTNNVTASGSGLLGVVSFVMEDVLAGKTEEENLVLQFANITATTPEGNKLSVLTLGDEVDIVLSGNNNPSATNKSLRVYPNPAQNLVNIQTGSTNAFSLTLLNAAGEKVHRQDLTGYDTSITIDTQNFAPGIYLLQVLTPDGMVTQKISIFHH